MPSKAIYEIEAVGGAQVEADAATDKGSTDILFEIEDFGVEVENAETNVEREVADLTMQELEMKFVQYREALEENAFVHIDGPMFRRLLLWQGAQLDDLAVIESGNMHADVAPDPEQSMHFRKIAFHRVFWDDNAKDDIKNAYSAGVTQICKEEIASDDGAKVFFERSKTRTWPLPPERYVESTVAQAIGKLNAMFSPEFHHAQGNIAHTSSTTINDQILISVEKKTDSEESPTPEGIHKDGTEISSVTLINISDGVRGGESRIWKSSQPTGNYSSDTFGEFKRQQSIDAQPGFDWSNCLMSHALTKQWETILFNDRKVKHEARAFDGPRPCIRDVIVNFVRKPLSDGSDKIE